jgi:hypothetical protein
MPRTEVVFYLDDDGSAPALDWLGTLTLKARLKCLVRLERLRELGHELRRPEADLLRDGIYELRVSLNHVQYRLLYGFHTEGPAAREASIKPAKKGSVRKGAAGKDPIKEPAFRLTIAVVAHGITKEDKVPDEEIDRAIARVAKFRADPRRHTYEEG